MRRPPPRSTRPAPLLPHPTSFRSNGAVHPDGRALRALAPHQRARLGLGRTFQGLDLYEDLTVEENVVVGQYVAGAAASAEHLAAVLAILDLTDDRERNAKELSHGQRQLVSITRALAGQQSEPLPGIGRAPGRDKGC